MIAGRFPYPAAEKAKDIGPMTPLIMQSALHLPLLHPTCPSCGRALHFARTVPRTDGLGELQTLSCRNCNLWITEAVAGEHPRSNSGKGS